MQAIIDSVVLIGAFYKNDQWHKRSAPIIMKADEGELGDLIISDFIVAEVLNFFNKRVGHKAAIECLNQLESNEFFHIERITDEQYVMGKDIYFRTYDRLSFVDALTLAYMKSNGIKHIYSFDSEFDGIKGITRLDDA
ncbi:MAG: type II toxin-antitoxin system VapC family toxin [Candidatus Methanospirareceae archaeon]